MLKRVAALLMILFFAGQAMAGGIVCGARSLSKSFSQTDEAACQMQGASDCDEMPCCALGKSPTGALAAMVCCELKCVESTGGAQFDFAPQNQVPGPRVISLRAVLLDATGEAETAVVSIKTAAYKLLHHGPLDLYLANSTFLI